MGNSVNEIVQLLIKSHLKVVEIETTLRTVVHWLDDDDRMKQVVNALLKDIDDYRTETAERIEELEREVTGG